MNATLGYTCYNMILDALNRAGKADTRSRDQGSRRHQGPRPPPVGMLTINATHDAEIPVGILKYDEREAHLHRRRRP